MSEEELEEMPFGASASAPVSDIAELSRAVVDSYVALYERRSAQSKDGVVFKSSEQNALLALFRVRLAALQGRDLDEALRMLDAQTTPILERDPGHAVATDIAGAVWAMAYGILPLEEPPRAQLEWVLESGMASHAVKGTLGAAWRAVFLAEAAPLVNWRKRATADHQLERWVDYVARKAQAAAADSAQVRSAVSPYARIAFALGELAKRIPDERIADAGRALTDVLSDVRCASGNNGGPQASLPSAHLAQCALAAYVNGKRSAAGEQLAALLRGRLQGDRQLLGVDSGDADGRSELSPWMPLGALILCEEAHEKVASRRLLRRRRRRS